MYLLHCSRAESDQALRICLNQYFGKIPPYAILSHRWLDDPLAEVSFKDCQDMEDIATVNSITRKVGYRKLEGCCAQALLDGFEHVWIDTCCIDKSSSTELSEAINSMYSWYEMSQKCYVYLADVLNSDDLAAEGSTFWKSAWFKRGWTLQELIAPTVVMFFDFEWFMIGQKIDLATTIASITCIDERILRDGIYAHRTSVAEKMSWAARRTTTREEDRAYSLLGLFGVSMPILYGEGRSAFIRLQLEIIRISNDHSIFAWEESTVATGALAESPSLFNPYSKCYPVSPQQFIKSFNIGKERYKPDYTTTNAGLHIQLPLAPIPDSPNYYYGFLACTADRNGLSQVNDQTVWSVIYLHRSPESLTRQFTRTSFQSRMLGFRRAVGQVFETEPIWLSLFEDIWPLTWDPPITETQTPQQQQNVRNDPEHTITLTLAKRNQNIEIVDVCPHESFISRYEISLTTHPGYWAMKKEFGRSTFPSIKKAFIGSGLDTNGIGFHPSFASGSRLVTVIVQNGIIGGRVLMVFVMMRGAWNLFLTEVDDLMTARECRDDLLVENAEVQTSSAPLIKKSPINGIGIPFSSEYKHSIRRGRYFMAVEHGSTLGYSTLSFRVSISFSPPLTSTTDKKIMVNRQVVEQSLLAGGRESFQVLADVIKSIVVSETIKNSGMLFFDRIRPPSATQSGTARI